MGLCSSLLTERKIFLHRTQCWAPSPSRPLSSGQTREGGPWCSWEMSEWKLPVNTETPFLGILSLSTTHWEKLPDSTSQERCEALWAPVVKAFRKKSPIVHRKTPLWYQVTKMNHLWKVYKLKRKDVSTFVSHRHFNANTSQTGLISIPLTPKVAISVNGTTNLSFARYELFRPSCPPTSLRTPTTVG